MNTNANNWITVITERNRLLLLANSDVSEMWFMSASCQASALERTNGHSFSLLPDKNKKGVVAVKIRYQRPGKSGQCGWLYYLLPLAYSQEPFAELNTLRHPFLPSVDNCLAQLCETGLFVTVGEKRFVAPDFGALISEQAKNTTAAWAEQRGIRIVPDANLLCRFLVGGATLEQVEAAAEAIEQEQAWPAQRDELKQQIAALEQEQKKNSKIRAEIEQQRDALAAYAFMLLVQGQYMTTVASTAGFGHRKNALQYVAACDEFFRQCGKVMSCYDWLRPQMGKDEHRYLRQMIVPTGPACCEGRNCASTAS